MCNRFSLVISQQELEEKFSILTNEPIRTSYNISPTQHSYIIANDNPRKLQYVTWGLVPSFSETGKNTGRLINARKENISSQTSFRIPIRKKRCLVLADSFYSWLQDGMEARPHRVKLKSGEIMVMAGVWDEWQGADNYTIKSFSIITTPSNAEMKKLDARMPVFLQSKEAQQKWLSDIELHEVQDMLNTLPDDTLYMYRISKQINNLNFNQIELHKNIAR